jgi:hypothetical protein
MRRSMILLPVFALLGSLLGCEPPPNPQVQVQPRLSQRSDRPANAPTVTGTPASSDFEIHLDRSAMATHRIDAAAVTAALSRFFEAYPYFSLSDLQEVKVRGGTGTDVPLKQIATIDVWFSAAKTEIVVGTK